VLSVLEEPWTRLSRSIAQASDARGQIEHCHRLRSRGNDKLGTPRDFFRVLFLGMRLLVSAKANPGKGHREYLPKRRLSPRATVAVLDHQKGMLESRGYDLPM
jgi:hypothetical protein